MKLRNGKTVEREAKALILVSASTTSDTLAQLASDVGAPTAKVQAALRHANPAMTRRYDMRKAKGEVAQLVGQALTTRGRGLRKS